MSSAQRRCTVVMVAQNEEHRIREPVEAAVREGFAVLVVDGGSADATVAVATDAGARVMHRAFDNMSGQLNWAVSRVDSEFVLVVDADETMSPELAADVRDAVDRDVDGAWVPNIDYFAGRWLTNYPQRHLRFFRAGAGHFENEVHQEFRFHATDPVVVDLHGPLAHRSHLTLSGFIEKLNRYTDGEQQRDLVVRRRGAWLTWRAALEAMASFGRWYVLRGGWRDGSHGFVHSVYLAMYRFTLWAKAATAEEVEPPTSEAAFAAWRARRPRR